MANNPKHWIGFSCCHKNVSDNTVQRRAMLCQNILDKFTHKLTYMAGSSQPQNFFAAGCVFADFAIAVIFILT